MNVNMTFPKQYPIIEIDCCSNCPFSNQDKEYGRDGCNLSWYLEKGIKLGDRETLPKFGVHELCPLKNEPITITL